MAARTLIIDCDPGVDDALALLLAFASPELEIAAVTTVAGNVGVELTARNARLMREIAGREDLPVHAGCARPLVREPVEADHFHGVTGLGELVVFEPAAPAEQAHAVHAIVEAVMSRPAGSVDVAVTGPMTNLAAAMVLEPRLAGRLGAVSVMGGARSEGGNITASAEYNIHADPHAADVVFKSGCRLVVFGLDATHQVRATPARMGALERIRTPRAQTALELLRFSSATERRLVGGDSPPLHDPCPVAWLLRPELFETRAARIEVETGSTLTLGHTAVEFRVGGERPPANAEWAVRADAEGVFDLLFDRLAQ